MSVLQQVGLLTSGAQPWHSNICDGNENYFAYCATLAIYIYKLDKLHGKYSLHSVMSEHKKTIRCIAWKKKEDIFASISNELIIIIWDVNQNRSLIKLDTVKLSPVLLQWCYHQNKTVSFMSSEGPLYLWEHTSAQNITTFKDSQYFSHPVCLFKWNEKRVSSVCFGHLDGSVSFVTSGKKAIKHVFSTVDYSTSFNEDPVMDIEWDLLSPDYLLVSTKHCGIKLVDSESLTVIMKYKLPSTSSTIRKLCWIESAPGMFLSADECSGVLRLWTVSKESPILNIKIKETGFHSLHLLKSKFSASANLPTATPSSSTSKASSSFLLTDTFSIPPARVFGVFNDGGVGVYDLKRRCWDFLREMGHVETIFDCEFSPDDPNLLSTASFDGSIKVWDITTMKALYVSPGNLSIIYSLSWAPGNLNCICVATSKKGLVIWNMDKDSVVQSFKEHGSHPVYSCAWNKLAPQLIASTGADKNCIIRSIDGSLVKKYTHPSSVYGCDWNPVNRDLIATSCEDAIVRVFYIVSDHTEPLKSFVGHTAKVFKVKWSQLKDGFLCSGSDDKTIRIWDYCQDGCIQCLEGHTAPVRGLMWNPEISNILISGSWDCTIKIWDTNNGYCVHTCKDHAGDVYGLTCHPQHPFLFASSSRDSTLRIWSLQAFVQPLYLCLLNSKNVDQVKTFRSEVHEKHVWNLMEEMQGAVKALFDLKGKESLATNAQMFSHCLLPATSLSNFWVLVSVLRDGKKAVLGSTYCDGVMHKSHLVKYKAAQAQEMELAKSSFSKGIASKKKEEVLLEAAKIHLSLGQIERYCELMVQLNQWEKALAIAPGVSMSYWKSLAERYSDVLAFEKNSSIINYCMATRDVQKLCKFFNRNGMYQETLLAVQVAMENDFCKGDVPSDNTHLEIPENTIKDLKRLEEESCQHFADSYFRDDDPIGASCCHLSIGDVNGAFCCLLRGNELELAYSLSKCLLVDRTLSNEVALLLARRCEKYNLWELAIHLLNANSIDETDLLYTCSRFPGSKAEQEKLLSQAGLPSIGECASKVKDFLADDNLVTALPFMAVAYDNTLSIVIERVKEHVTDPNWKLTNVLPFMNFFWNINTQTLLKSQPKIRNEILALCSYFGAYRAIQLNFGPVVVPLFQHTSSIVRNHNDVDIGISAGEVQEELDTWIVHNVDRCSENHFVQSPTNEQKTLYNKFLIRSGDTSAHLGGIRSVIGEHLPSHNISYINMFSKEIIKGPTHILEDGIHTLPLSIALMWAQVNSFSPLSTGNRINPY